MRAEAESRRPWLIAVMGPTASGKSALAEKLADVLDAQLINADAFQIYRGLDIGTAKPARRELYKLLDLKDPWESFGVGEFVQTVQGHLGELYAQGRDAIIVGGTGLYIRALLESYAGMGEPPPPELRAELTAETLDALVERLQILDPAAAARIDLKNPARVRRAVERLLSPSPSISTHLPPFRKVKLALDPPIEEVHSRIVARTKEMLSNGWIEEVGTLRGGSCTFHDPGLRAIGYRPLWNYLDGKVELEEAEATAIAETKRYAKRQRTWLRSEPDLQYLNWQEPLASAKRVMQLD